MKRIQKISGGGILGVILAVTMAAMPGSMAMASADDSALAAVNMVYVDDDPDNNGSVSCPATTNLTLFAGFINAGLTNATITICPGTYATGSISISGASNLKVIAKGNPIIKPTTGFTGSMLSFTNSANVTVQGLSIIADSDLGATTANAISFSNTSGSILKNTILHWHEADLDGSTATHYGIRVVNTVDKDVKIDHNTIYDFQLAGIYVESAGKITVSHNLLNAASGSAGHSTYGIYLSGTESGSVTSNTLRSDDPFNPGPHASYGIWLFESSNIKVKSNTIDGWRLGAYVLGQCFNYSASNNTISGNKLVNNHFGVWVEAMWNVSCLGGVDHNTISGNTFTINSYDANYAGILVTTSLSGLIDATKISGNKFYGYPDPLDIGTGGSVTNTTETGTKIYQFPLPGS